MTPNSLNASPTNGLRDAMGRTYIPAVSPRLKILLALIFLAVAVLGASGAYLTSIRLLDSFSGHTYTKAFKYWMLLAHIGVGLVMLIPFLAFGIQHWRTALNRPNRFAVKLGILLFSVGVLVCASGLALIRLDGMPQFRTDSSGHSIVLWLHVVLPLLAVVLYILHRRAGPDITWSWGACWGVAVGLCVVAMY